METLNKIFGTGEDMSAVQMMCRAAAIFFIALALIRISGRRSFGIRTAFDNIIMILLGAILARAVTGISPFVPTISACLVIVVLHRLLGAVMVVNEPISKFVDGEKIVLYENGRFDESKMIRALVGKEDIYHAVRKNLHTVSLETIDTIYMERDGEISIVTKDKVTTAAPNAE